MALDSAGVALRARLLDAFAQPIDRPLDDAVFDSLARDIFAFQFERNAPLAAWCRRRGVHPGTVDHWSRIPAVPTAAFKEVALVAGDAAAADAVFRTSGTTAGEEHRGTHWVLDASIYRAALRPAFQAWVLPDDARPRMLSLLPPARELPDSSLAFMVDDVSAAFGAPGSGVFASVEHGLDVTALGAAIGSAIDDAEPVCLLGTSLSFVHWTDALHALGTRYSLPDGSRLMDTGGFKGRGREVDADTLRGIYRDRLGLRPEACVNEYGMTEMTSQFYDSTLRLPGPRRKTPPPWVRTLIVDPDTLRPLDDPSATGLLRHVDLGNLGSVIAIQTEDLGVAMDDGFHVLGRAAGAQPRGCSIAMDELLGAVRDRA